MENRKTNKERNAKEKHLKIAFIHLKGLECSVKNLGFRAWTITTSNKSLQSSPTRYFIPLFLEETRKLGFASVTTLISHSHKVVRAVRDQEKFFIGARQTVKELPHIRSRLDVVLHMLAHNFMHNWVRWANCVLTEQIKQKVGLRVVSVCVSGSFSGQQDWNVSIDIECQRDKVCN